MRIHTLAFLALAACCIANDRVAPQELPFFGQLPKLDENWKLLNRGKNGESWGWVIMTNGKSGDLLSFAAHRLGPGERKELILFSDTSHELFPTGLPSWLKPRADKPDNSSIGGVSSIRNRVMKFDLPKTAEGKKGTKEALEYTFIYEDENAPNRMAHGYALIFGNLAVFVQHTSVKPITDEIAQGTAWQLIATHERREADAKAKPDIAPKPKQ